VRRRALLQAAGAGILGAGAAALGGFSAPAIAQSSRPVTLTLPWLANGSTLFTYVTKHQGFFSKRGLDVTISRGFGSVAAAQAVGAGKFDFGYVFAGGVILGAAQGLPLVGLSTICYDAGMSLIVRADSGIKTPKDLEGKRIGTVPTSAESPYWPAFAKQAGIDTSKITLVQMDSRVIEQGLVNKQVDAITAIASSSVPVLLAMKQQCHVMLWSTAHVDMYAGQVVTQQATLAKDPGVCQAMTEALAEGLAFTLRDPDAAIDIFLKELPEIGMTAGGRENARISQGLMQYTVAVPEAIDHGLGYTDIAKAGKMIDLVMEYGAAKGAVKPDVNVLYNNRFSGKPMLSAAEWQAVEKYVAPYGAMLS
jgi:ABC-type nitrate/sulfonate/bicarbonate transport system substrate-binding protein